MQSQTNQRNRGYTAPFKRFLIFVSLLFLLMQFSIPTEAQTSPDIPCDQRATFVSIPTADLRLFCLERVMASSSTRELAFTGLALLPDGRLFTVSPLEGTLIELVDTDGDTLPDTSEIRAEGLERPVAIAAYQDSLYITGGSPVYRWTEADGIETIIADLSAESSSITGFWNGGVTVGGDGEEARLYVGVGAVCDFCDEAVENTNRGVILSFALDGTDRQLVATGFRQPSGLMWYQDSLWVTDIAPAHLDTGQYDELNQIVLANERLNYGAPYCGGENEPLNDRVDCTNTIAPRLNFPSGSVPAALAAYHGSAFPSYVGQFVIAFSGTANTSRMQGYTVEFFALTEGEDTASQLTLVPALPDRDQQYGGVGFYPHHVYGLAVSPEGWIYFSVGGGSIYAIRPA